MKFLLLSSHLTATMNDYYKYILRNKDDSSETNNNNTEKGDDSDQHVDDLM